MSDFFPPADGGGDTVARPSAGRRAASRIGGFLRDVVIIVVAAVVISFLIKTFLIRSFYIPSQSMEETLRINDRIIVNQLVPRFFPIERGDVVVFRDPGDWLEPIPVKETNNPIEAVWDGFLQVVGLSVSDSEQHLIKRVIGVGGDRVICCTDEGQITVNGVPLNEAPYIQVPSSNHPASMQAFDVTVPEASLWVMGDNRYASADSRAHMDGPTKGFVRVDDVVGKALVITWPTSRWGTVDSHYEVFDAVPDRR
jgi:signal peptidase I